MCRLHRLGIIANVGRSGASTAMRVWKRSEHKIGLSSTWSRWLTLNIRVFTQPRPGEMRCASLPSTAHQLLTSSRLSFEVQNKIGSKDKAWCLETWLRFSRHDSACDLHTGLRGQRIALARCQTRACGIALSIGDGADEYSVARTQNGFAWPLRHAVDLGFQQRLHERYPRSCALRQASVLQPSLAV